MQGQIDVVVYIFVHVSICLTEKALDVVRSGHLLKLTMSTVSNAFYNLIPHTVVGVCGEFQRTGRFLQRGI